MKILEYGLMTKKKLKEIMHEREMPVVVCAKPDCTSELIVKDPYVIVANSTSDGHKLIYHFSCCPSELVFGAFEELKKKSHYSTQ